MSEKNIKKTITYKQLSRTYGKTIPHIKKVFVEAGWLNKNSPTQTALSEGIVTEHKLTEGDTVIGTQLRWDKERATQMLEQNGIKPLDERTKNLFIAHRHQAIDRLIAAAAGLGKLIGCDPVGMHDEEINWERAPNNHVGYLYYEGALLLCDIGGKRDLRQLIYSRFDPIFEEAQKQSKNRAEIDYWREVVENTTVWLERLHLQERRRN